MKSLENIEIEKKKIIFRADLNVPVVDGKITDYSRINSIIPSIKKLTEKKNKIFIISHFGRPKGNVDKKLSIDFLREELRQKLKVIKIYFLKSVDKIEIANKLIEMEYGEICLCENIRFYKEEENNELDFIKKISQNFDIFINDAFSASHRNHASIVGIPKFLPSYAGLYFKKEIDNLNKFFKKTRKPNIAIIGGSKISTKIKVIYNLMNLYDTIVIGGAMANTFLLAKNINIGRSLHEKNFVKIAKDILSKAEDKKCKILLPIDAVCSKNLEYKAIISKCDINHVPNDEMVLDIGEKTINLIQDEITKSKSILWNGPLGAFEFEPFNNSSIKISKIIKERFINFQIDSLAGGGDTLSAINMANAKDGFTYLSNAGGAFLEWLEGNDSPGYLALKNNKF